MTKHLVSPDQMISTITKLERLGWERWGVTLKKGDHQVTLMFDGQMALDGDPKTAPPELMAMVRTGGRQ